MKLKHIAILLTLVCALAMLTGCMRSKNALYTEDTIVFNEELLGEWGPPETRDGDAGIGWWTFEKDGEDRYTLTMSDGENNIGYFDCVLTDIDGTTYLDFFPQMDKFDEIEALNDTYENEMIPPTVLYMSHMGPDGSAWHGIMRLSIEDGVLSMQDLNFDWFQTYQQGEDALSHTPDEPTFVTDTTENLRAFYEEIAATPEHWTDPMQLVPAQQAAAAGAME